MDSHSPRRPAANRQGLSFHFEMGVTWTPKNVTKPPKNHEIVFPSKKTREETSTRAPAHRVYSTGDQRAEIAASMPFEGIRQGRPVRQLRADAPNGPSRRARSNPSPHSYRAMPSHTHVMVQGTDAYGRHNPSRRNVPEVWKALPPTPTPSILSVGDIPFMYPAHDVPGTSYSYDAGDEHNLEANITDAASDLAPRVPNDRATGFVKEMESLATAMMTVDNGFEDQWWNQGTRLVNVAGELIPANVRTRSFPMESDVVRTVSTKDVLRVRTAVDEVSIQSADYNAGDTVSPPVSSAIDDMCGRYTLALRPSQVRRFLEDDGMSVEDAPEDEGPEAPRQTYNFAPTYRGIVYRAHAAEGNVHEQGVSGTQAEDAQSRPETAKDSHITYKLQTMKWGLIPSWTKRSPAYGDIAKAINCRSDSLSQQGGMWSSMKKRKRCIVIAQGFFEWLQKGPKGKVPHHVKRSDGRLMYFAGLWDAAKFEDTDETIYTYSIITTDANEQMKFLHSRMPVILEPGSKNLRAWLDPEQTEWSGELQALLKPFDGDLEVYPVNGEVGKVGRDSPSFVIPLDSKENKSNIANFFANSPKKSAIKEPSPGDPKVDTRKTRKASPADDLPKKRAKISVSSTSNPVKGNGGKKTQPVKPAGAPRITDFFSRGT